MQWFKPELNNGWKRRFAWHPVFVATPNGTQIIWWEHYWERHEAYYIATLTEQQYNEMAVTVLAHGKAPQPYVEGSTAGQTAPNSRRSGEREALQQDFDPRPSRRSVWTDGWPQGGV